MGFSHEQIKLSVMMGAGGGDWNGQAYFRDAVNDYFSFWCPWIVMYCKTVLCIIIKVHSVKSELPKSSIVYKINWRKQSLIWPNDLNRTIARWRYLTTESFDVTLHTQHVVEMKCQYLLHHFSCRCLLARLLFVNLWRNPPPPFLLHPSNKEVSVLSGCP